MEKKEIDISVIVPIYNVEEYLEECLDSLLKQGKVRLEVIMVDDGSTDGSMIIAKKYEREYDNFHLYSIPNGGLGHARNYAVPFTSGKYIIFLDSDDVVVDGTYEKMFFLAEKNNSDLTICNVARFNPNKVWSSTLHKNVFYNIEPVTHISKNCNLFYDTTSWNKLILRSFYLEHEFQFPENILYEDIPVTIPMHYYANRVAVLTDIGYLWRVRDGASKSITQSISNLENLYDRIKILKMLDEVFAKNVEDPYLLKKKQSKALEVDLMIFVNVCPTVPEEQALEIMHLINNYIRETIREDAFNDLRIIDQQKYEYVREENLSGLIRVLEYERECYSVASVKEDEDLFVELPEEIFTIKNRNITKELVKYEPRYYIDDIVVEKGKIEIAGHLYRSRMNIKEHAQQKMSAYLYNALTGSKIPLEVIPEEKHDLTESVGITTNPITGAETIYNYDGTGFRILICIEKLDFGKENIGWNQVLVEYENRFSKGYVILGGCSSDLKGRRDETALLFDNNILQLKFDYLNKVKILLKYETVFKEAIEVNDKEISCKVNHTIDAMWAVDTEDEKNVVSFVTNDNLTFFAPTDVFEKNKWYCLFVSKNGEERILISKSKKITFYDVQRLMLVENTQKTFGLRIALYDFLAIAKMSVEETNNHLIKFSVRATGNIKEIIGAETARLCVRDWISGEAVVLGERKCILKNEKLCCTFSVDFGNENIIRNFYQSIRDLYIEYVLENGDVVKASVYSRRRFIHNILLERLEISCYRGLEGSIRLKMVQIWKEEENSWEKRQALMMKNYPIYRQEKINSRQIIFESMWGRKYSCNPQALYEYIDEHYPEYECIWSLNDARTPVRGNAKRVRRGSQEYYHYLATAKYFVNNVNFETAYVKRPGQIEIQTMHGTPLKTLGLDVESDFRTEKDRKQYIEKNSRWNYLVVQGEFMKQKAKSCFEFDKQTLCTGYPRTDRLFECNDQKKKEIKEKLGLPVDKKIILYAPTWRVKTRFDMELELEKMRKTLGEQYILLVRLHHFSAKYYVIPEDHEFIYNFNSYRYVEELFMITDILITDYSSVMFDYALLRKPMLFFTYDLEEYSGKLRGLYIDFKKEAPGPLLFSTEEVISAIINLDQEMEKCKERVEKFYKKFLTYEQPDSAQRIVKEVFRPNPVVHFIYKIREKINKKRFI